MRLSLPIKILLWFFLNLAILVAVFVLLFSAEYQFNLDWLFASAARQRVDAMRDLVVDDLNTHPPDEWEDVLDRFSTAYRVRFTLFDDRGRHLLGPIEELPPTVRQEMGPMLRPPPPPFRPLSPSRPAPPPSPAAPATAASGQKLFLRTLSPTRYWLAVAARVDNPQAGGPMHLNIVAEAASAGMGGLIIDPTPWIRLAAGAVVFSVLFWLPLLRGLTRAIRQITLATRQIAEGRFDARVHIRRRDELGSLAEAINQMAVRLDGLLKGQKRFLGDVAHELCSPLARLQLTLGIIEQQADGSERQQRYARTAMEKSEQIARLVDQLLAFSRASLGESGVRWQAVDLRTVAEAAVRQEIGETAADGTNGHHGLADIRLDIAAGLKVRADEELLGRALGNLLRNAVRHGGGSGITVHAAPTDGEDTARRPKVEIVVADHGPGVPPEELPKIFDAFYRVETARTRETGGVGLGLSIVRMCVEACGGTVSARNRTTGGSGLEVVLRLEEKSEVGNGKSEVGENQP